MNAERLHAVAQRILDDFGELNLVNLLGTAVSTLSSSVTQPNAQNAEAFNQALADLRDKLRKCASNTFVPSYFRILEAIGGADKTGTGLASRVEALLEEERITPATALTQIQELSEEVTKFHQQLKKLVEAFKALNVARDVTSGGEAELGVLLPRELVSNDLEGLTRELRLIDRHLKVLAEVAGGEAGSFGIRSLGTDSLDVFLAASPVVAACIMHAAERLAGLYKQILEIRILRRQLEEKRVPKNAIEPIRKHEEEIIRRQLGEISDEIMSRFYRGADAARKNELGTALSHALKFLADRIDRGLDIEASAEIPTQQADEQPTPVGGEPREEDPRRAIASTGASMRRLARSTEPVLQLPDSDRREIEDENRG